MHHGIDELFLTALRIFLLQNHHTDSVISLRVCLKFRNGSLHRSDGLRLVLLDSDYGRTSAEHIFHYCSTDHNLLAAFDHYPVVGSQIRLTLRTVENQALGLLARRRAKFHVCRESRSTEPDDTVQLDLVENCLCVLRYFSDKGVRKVDSLCPLITFNLDFHMGDVPACKVLARADGLDRTGNR